MRFGISVCLLLLALAGWQVLSPVGLDLPATPIRARENLIPKDDTQSPSSVPPREDFAEIKERPPFVLGRRPPAALSAAPLPAAQTQALDQYALLGIVAAPDRATALLRGPSGAMIHLRAGQTLEGWTLQTIAPSRLVFGSAGQTQEIQLKINKNQQTQGTGRTSIGTSR